jgi:hypothetical protein
MSLFARLQHIAAYHKPGDWPEGSRVAMQPPPAFISDPKAGGIPDIGANTGFNALSQVEQKRYLDYLTELDRWASNAFGYNTSSLDSLMMTAIQMGQINMQRMGLAAEAAQAQPIDQTQSAPARPVPQRSGRPRATRS